MTFDAIRAHIIAKEHPASVTHAARATVAAVVSLLVARLFQLPESYWAAITTLIVMQSTVGAALPISAQQFAGAAIGALVGALVGNYFPGNVVAFGMAVFGVGIACTWFRVDRVTYRYANVTLAIVMLVPWSRSEWAIALHRFCEVSIGIAVGLALTAFWPEPERDDPARAPAPSS